jgi:methanethiol S-methyltransferase
MKRWLFFLYGVTCHVLFLGTFAWLAAFVGGLFVPKSVDFPASTLSAGQALAVNGGLLGLFAAQHSIMARPGFKRLWTRIIPQPIERSTYVLASCVVTVALMLFWQGMGSVAWDVQNSLGRATLWALFAFGWLLVPAVSLMIDHFDLFGTRQVWLYLRGQEYRPLPFRTPWLYGRVRHPLYIGWAIAFWATPTMTLGHLVLASVMTVYMVLATVVEERDLIAHFGQQYLAYRREVPRFVPRRTRPGVAMVTTQQEDAESVLELQKT